MSLQRTTADLASEQIKTDDDRRLASSTSILFRRLQKHLRGATMTQGVYDSTVDLVVEHVAQARKRGINFPEMAVIYLTGVRAIEVVRRDMDEGSVRQWIANLQVRFPGITGREVLEAVKTNFPWFGKDNVH